LFLNFYTGIQCFFCLKRLAIQEEILRKQEALKEDTKRLREERRKLENGHGSPTESSLSSPSKSDGFPANYRAMRRSMSRRRRSASESSDCSPENSEVVVLDFLCLKTWKQFHRGNIIGILKMLPCISIK